MLNPFVVYPKYGSLHKLVATAAYSPPAEGLKQFKEQVKASTEANCCIAAPINHASPSLQDLLPDDFAPLIGAIYEVVTLSRTKNPSQQINPEVCTW